MSDLLNSASLVLIPSGYKEDVLYSQVPTDGSADMSFTRASNGTRINSAGLVEVVAWNLYSYSEIFSGGGWFNDGTSTATNNFTTAPNGTMTAAKVVANTANGYAYKSTIVAPNTYTLSYYVRASANTTMSIAINDPGGSGSSVKSNIAVTTQWQRIEHSALVTLGTSFYIDYAALQTGVDYFIWGAQVNLGSTAKPYFPTTDRLNVPRLTYQNGGGGCPSLLLEKQSTNLVTYSEQFDNAAWTKNVSVTANAITSPDGTQNADKILENASNVQQWAYQSPSMTGAQTATIYAKKGERNYIAMATAGLDSSYFNLDTGVVVSSASGATASIENVGNGWYRCSVSSPSIVGGTFFIVWISDNGTRTSYAGDSSKGVYVWGAQNEASSYATSYIPTTSASATRVADACFKTGISSLIGQTEGTLFIDMVPTDVSGQGRFMNIYNGANSSNGWNAIISSGSTPNTFRFYGNGFDFSGGACLFGVRVKAALAYKNGVLTSAYVNGASVGTLTAVTTGKSYDKLELGSGPFGLDGSCNVNQSIIFPTALTNAELASLTTI
jgi:hypothetical protein